MFKVILESDEHGRERFTFDTLDEALAAIERLYHECQSDKVERAIGLLVNDQSDPKDAWVCPTCCGCWQSDEAELIYAPSGVPYCPACEEMVMVRA